MARGRGSMRDRMERLRAEAAANEREREEKRKAREAAGPASGASRPSGPAKKQPAPGATRMKIVWAICDRRAEPVKTFAFPKKAEAEEELARMNAEADFHHQFMLQQTRVPLDA